MSEQASKAVMVRALREIKELKQKVSKAEQRAYEPIAVVGMACRFPGNAGTPDAFWELLANGTNAITSTPPERWDVEGLYDPDMSATGKMYSKMGGFITDVEQFDPTFFGISPREADMMDPQQRLLLTVSWEALENAGIATSPILNQKIGVFVAIATNDYMHLLLTEMGLEDVDAYTLTGNDPATASGRIAYALGLHGPAISVDTACSSSLVALHLACQSLRQKECETAVVSGVNLLLSPLNTVAFCRMNAMSPDGICRTFDAGANGYVRGEGCGAIVVKRLSSALADGDKIWAVVRGSAVNQDGRSAGLTVPDGNAQQRVIRSALAIAGIQPHQISYIEAHGTATPIGDAIELSSLNELFHEGRSADNRLLIGSVKTNFGHLEGAAGMASLMKGILALHHQVIPPHLHFETPNPRVDWENSPLQVVQSLTDWQTNGGTRLAGVNGFGISGTNAHIILEEPPAEVEMPASPQPAYLFTLSAWSEAGLTASAERMLGWLATNPQADLGQVCYTANCKRAHFNWRLGLVVRSLAELQESLATFVAGEMPALGNAGKCRTHIAPPVSFLFGGQGGQRVGMGHHLYQHYPAFRAVVDACAGYAEPYFDQPFTDLLYDPTHTGEPFEDLMVAQLGLYVLQVALCRLLEAWGIEPTTLLGLSLGEYSAGVIAGSFDLATGFRLLAERAKLMKAQTVQGELGVVFASRAEVAAHLSEQEEVWIAGQNTEQEVVLSGRAGEVTAKLQQFEEAGFRTRQLTAFSKSGYPFHTPLTAPLVAEYAPILATASLHPPQLEVISTLTGQKVTTEWSETDYWQAQTSQPTNLAGAMQNWLADEPTVAVEISPSSAMMGIGKRIAPTAEIAWLPAMRKGEDECRQLLSALAGLYVNGVPIDWQSWHGNIRQTPVMLPNTPMQMARYWLKPRPERLQSGKTLTGKMAHPSEIWLGERVISPVEMVQFGAKLNAGTLPFIKDHVVHSLVVVAGAAHLARLFTGARAMYGDVPITVEDVTFARALVLTDEEMRHCQLIFEPESKQTAQFSISSRALADDRGVWLEHVSGKVSGQSGGDCCRHLLLP